MRILVITVAVLATVSGSIQLESRIIGGSSTVPGEFPYQVSLQRDKGTTNDVHSCAGAIYDQNNIVTAAHCVINYVNTSGILSIVAGAYNIAKQESTQQRVPVSQIFVHPNYTPMNKSHDVAVLKLARPLVFNRFVQPIAFNTKGNKPEGRCITAGWGNTLPISAISYRGSDTLQKVTSLILAPELCRAAYPIFRVQLNHTICARAIPSYLLDLSPFKGNCQGDSGGPMVCTKADKTPYVAGIVSWGFIACGTLPDVYADVGDLRDFLDKALNGSINGGSSTPAPSQSSTSDTTKGPSSNGNSDGTTSNDNTGGASSNDNSGGASSNDNSGGASSNDNSGGASSNNNTGGANSNDNSGGASSNDNSDGVSSNENSDGGSSNDISDGGSSNNNSEGGSSNDNSNGGSLNNNAVGGSSSDNADAGSSNNENAGEESSNNENSVAGSSNGNSDGISSNDDGFGST